MSKDIALYLSEPDILSNEVLSLDGLHTDYISVGTSSGITVRTDEAESYSSSGISNILAVKISDEGSVYYGGTFGLAKKSSTISGNWSDPDYLLNTSTVPPIPPVSQIDVVPDNGKNVIGVSTSNGVYIYKEEEIVTNSSIIQLLKS